MESRAPFAEALSVAAASLRSSKLRSFLTLLGIILATTTLIAVMSVIEGMNRYIAERVSDMGADGFRVRRMAMIGEWDPKKYLEMRRRNPELTVDEYEFLRERATLVREIGMEAWRGVSVRYGTDHVDSVGMRGVTTNMGLISNVQAAVGRFLADAEDRQRVNAAFIGNDIKERFFASVDPVGKVIYLSGRPFEVVGVAKKLGSVFGQSRDNFIMIPIQTLFKMYGSRGGLGFNALARDRAHYNQAQEQVQMLLRAHRQLRPNEEDTFGMFGSDSLVEAWDRLTGVIAATAVAIVSVFMVVSGVVIMNIMLAVVTERTHEIGIRKAVGARQRDIMNQFLVESSMLAASGGLIGVALAWLVASLVRNLTPVPMALPVYAVVVGVGLSAAVGLFFGIYPAHRASQLDPIVALRAEK
jgi:putative ABC transport system permease protein